MRIRGIIFLIFNMFCGFVLAQVPDSLASRFQYQRSAFPKHTIDSSDVKDNVIIERITYTSTNDLVVSAYITHPSKTMRNTPLILFNHWGEGDKDEFLNEAISFSAKGFSCILPDGPWLCPDTPIKSFKHQGYEMYQQYVMNARVAIDIAEQQQVNTKKIFCVGHSFGCNTAALLSAIDQRIGYFVFMAGVYSTTENITNSKFPDFVEWKTGDPEQFHDWVKKMKPLDSRNFLPYKTAPCLIQVANQDEYITRAENEAFIRNTPKPKDVKRYDCGHALNKQARLDRETWILQQLKN